MEPRDSSRCCSRAFAACFLTILSLPARNGAKEAQGARPRFMYVRKIPLHPASRAGVGQVSGRCRAGAVNPCENERIAGTCQVKASRAAPPQTPCHLDIPEMSVDSRRRGRLREGCGAPRPHTLTAPAHLARGLLRGPPGPLEWPRLPSPSSDSRPSLLGEGGGNINQPTDPSCFWVVSEKTTEI